MALFPSDLTQTYRSRWVSIQSSSVDDPRQAVRSGDELVAEIMTNLANTFADERHKVEGQLDEPVKVLRKTSASLCADIAPSSNGCSRYRCVGVGHSGWLAIAVGCR